LAKYIITQTRTEEYQAEVEADSAEHAWEMLHDDEVEFEFLMSDDEFVVHKKEVSE
jgi:hypothetical protein